MLLRLTPHHSLSVIRPKNMPSIVSFYVFYEFITAVVSRYLTCESGSNPWKSTKCDNWCSICCLQNSIPRDQFRTYMQSSGEMLDPAFLFSHSRTYIPLPTATGSSHCKKKKKILRRRADQDLSTSMIRHCYDPCCLSWVVWITSLAETYPSQPLTSGSRRVLLLSITLLSTRNMNVFSPPRTFRPVLGGSMITI